MHPHHCDLSEYYGGVNFDLEADFLQFLDEARKGKTEACGSTSIPDTESAAKRVPDEANKSKRSWRNSLFSWLKLEKRGKDRVQPATTIGSNRRCAPKRGHVSGPIIRGSSGRDFDGRLLRRMNSASLSGLFSPRKRVENEANYVCLEGSGYGVKGYGPVYLVT